MSVNEKMTAIADAIRQYTGDTEKLTLDAMAEGIPRVRNKGYSLGYNAGSKKGKEEGIAEGREAERTDFWLNFFVARMGDFTYAFYKMDNFSYTLDRTPTPITANYMYTQSTMSEIVVDMSNTTSATAMFSASSATTITITSTETTAWNTGMFSGRYSAVLTNFTVNGVIAKSFSVKTLLINHDGLMSIVNALKDFSEDTSGTSYKADFGSSNLNRLTDEEKALIQSKGWTYT